MKTFEKLRQDLVEAALNEDAPANNAGGGNIAGIGVGAQGEPGVSPKYQRKRKQLKLMNGPAVDPRMFSDKIFRRKAVTEAEKSDYPYQNEKGHMVDQCYHCKHEATTHPHDAVGGLSYCGNCGNPTCSEHRDSGHSAEPCLKCAPKLKR